MINFIIFFFRVKGGTYRRLHPKPIRRNTVKVIFLRSREYKAR